MRKNSLLSTTSAFSRDTRGNIIILFAPIALVTSMVVVGVFDYLRVKRAELQMQQITDAAVLIAKRTEAAYLTANGISKQQEARDLGETRAKSYFKEQMAPKTDLFGNANTGFAPKFTWNNGTGDLKIEANIDVATFFKQSVFPSSFYKVAVTARAELNIGIPTEIALVLDNTGSMFEDDGRGITETRFKLLRSATMTFVNNIFDAAQTSNNPDAVRVSVVPWTTVVNIKGEAPADKNYDTYAPAVPPDKGTQTQVANPISRSVSMNSSDFQPVGWRGCITGETVESQSTFTDAGVSGWKAALNPQDSVTVKISNGTDRYGNPTCSGAATTQTLKKCNSNFHSSTTCYSGLSNNGCYTNSQLNSTTYKKTVTMCTADYNEPGNQSGAVNWCSWISKMEWKNYGGGSIPTTAGPNENCPAPMLGLSGNRKQVIDTINRMSPNGSTHQDVGLRWGLRTLSPNNSWPSFFGLKSNEQPKPFKGNVEKVLVLITDGENTVPSSQNPGYWGCSSGCTSTVSDTQLDSMTLSWCSAMRNTYGIKVYTVALNLTNATAKQLLKDCVGSANPERAFSVDAANLQDALKSIGRELKSLKLTM